MAQFNKNTQLLLNQDKSLYEVMMLANRDGLPIDEANPLHVSLGSENITITGDVNVGTEVTVNSTPEDPVHVHLTEMGDLNLSGLTSLPVSVSNFPATQTVSGSVNIGSMPEVEIKNDSGNPVPVTGSLSFSYASSAATDAFGRQRVSNPLTLFDSSHRFADNGLWNTSTATGGSSSFSANEGLISMTVNGSSGAEVVRETTKVFSYQPGKSLLILNTFVPATPQANLRQRVGYFGTSNGMYYELNGTTPAFVERSSVSGSLSETKISRIGGVYGVDDTGWNVDKLNGSGPSGLTFNNDKAQILWMDIEWLGLGSVRMGFVIDGKFVHCHTFHHANRITSTYILTASLPLRYEITNTGTTSGGTLKQICSSVLSEGGYELRGLQQAIYLPVNAPRACSVANTYYPVISLRLKTSPNRLDAIVILTALSLLGLGNNAIFNWQVVASGTTTGGDWVSAGDNSSVNYNITGTSFTGGRILASGYCTSSAQGQVAIDILKEALFKFQLERNTFTSTPFELTLVVASKIAGDLFYASMDWEEISR
jgi:hypothetical protein